MSTGGTQRRLAAILAADVVGYSRLMGSDEAGTLSALKALRTELLNPKIAEHSGRVFKTTGDGLLIEFSSVVNAVSSAVAIQQAIAEEKKEPKIQLRIGINVGDVIVEEGDVFGDGVNVAARVESLAPPGGIALSEMARDHLGSSLKLDFTDTGSHSLKNIERPIRVFVISGPNTNTYKAEPTVNSKPTVAVLPLMNMSGDPSQQYFSDGVTEDIITELSRFRSLSVMARNSSFRYRGGDIDVVRVGRELGVQYVLVGSIRKLGPKIRLTTQLIDARTGAHVWAEKFDRHEEEIFAVQDAIVRSIASIVSDRVDIAALDRSSPLKPAELKAYDLHLRAKAHFLHPTKANMEQAIALSKRAIELDPSSAVIHAFHAHYWFLYWIFLWAPDLSKALENATHFSKRALELDNTDATGHWSYGVVLTSLGNFRKAQLHFDRALELNPNDNASRCFYGYFLTAIGQPEEALVHFDIARRQNPFDQFNWLKGIAFFTARRYEEAINAYSQYPEPNQEVRLWLAACYAQLDQMDDAKVALNSFYELARRDMADFPGDDAQKWMNYLPFLMPYEKKNDQVHLQNAVRKAGLPV
jgi:adenylate cyclase